MTFDELNAALEERYARIEGELESAGEAPRPERERLRGEIVGLFRETEAALERLAEFKERIRGLVERYKQLPAPRAFHPRPRRELPGDVSGSAA